MSATAHRVRQRAAAGAAPRRGARRGHRGARRARRAAAAGGPDADRDRAGARRRVRVGRPGRARRAIVAHAHAATAAHVDAAVARAVEGQRAWSSRSAAERAAVLRRAADLLRDRRLELAALAVRECGKPWPEADGDVCEAIDFLEYYAAGAEALDRGRALIQLPGERNTMRYVPRGVTAVIAPWNFPLAIAAGMTSAALATGNAVVLKPAEQAPACAKAVVDALHAAGVPHDALAPAARRRRARPRAGRRPARPHDRLHRLVRGGALDPGARGQGARTTSSTSRRSSPRWAARTWSSSMPTPTSTTSSPRCSPAPSASPGQKCSAASRVLVHAQIADALAERLAGAIRTLQVGPAEDFATDVAAGHRRGRADARAPLRGPGRRGRHARRGGRRPAGATASTSRRRCWSGCPTSIRSIQDEIFGPVLALQSRRVDRGGVRRRSTHRASRSPAGSSRARRARWSWWPRARRSATCTSTGRSRGRWSAASRSAAAGCRAPARRPAGPTTCCSSSRRGRSPRTPSATAWWSERSAGQPRRVTRPKTR